MADHTCVIGDGVNSTSYGEDFAYIENVREEDALLHLDSPFGNTKLHSVFVPGNTNASVSYYITEHH